MNKQKQQNDDITESEVHKRQLTVLVESQCDVHRVAAVRVARSTAMRCAAWVWVDDNRGAINKWDPRSDSQHKWGEHGS